LRSPPEFNGPRLMTGTSSVRAARIVCCILLPFSGRALFLSRAYDAFTRHVHPEHNSSLRDTDQSMQPHADQRKDDQNGEGAGHVEIEVLLQDEISDTCLCPDKFADDRPDD